MRRLRLLSEQLASTAILSLDAVYSSPRSPRHARAGRCRKAPVRNPIDLSPAPRHRRRAVEQHATPPRHRQRAPAIRCAIRNSGPLWPVTRTIERITAHPFRPRTNRRSVIVSATQGDTTMTPEQILDAILCEHGSTPLQDLPFDVLLRLAAALLGGRLS